MPISADLAFTELLLDELTIDDEASFRHVALYADLKQVLRKAGYRFRVLPESLTGRWEHALLLNLTFHGAETAGDVLIDSQPFADVVAHAAWHYLASRAIGGDAPTATALFLGEAIASAFDVYLVGRLLGHAPDSTFVESQVLAMADCAEAAGLAADDFDGLLQSIALDPDRAFSDLRELLCDATAALFLSDTAEAALVALSRFDAHRFAPLLHHYELSNWVLYARAYAHPSAATDARVMEIERALRAAPVALDWLTKEWVQANP